MADEVLVEQETNAPEGDVQEESGRRKRRGQKRPGGSRRLGALSAGTLNPGRLETRMTRGNGNVLGFVSIPLGVRY